MFLGTILNQDCKLLIGHLYVKSDVYGFGVVLLEIITGLRVLDPNRPRVQSNLVEWARPSLPDKKKLKKLMDPRLQEEYPLKAAYATAELILKCLKPDPKSRPDMEGVLECLENISKIQMKPKKQKGRPKQGPRRHNTYHGGGGGGGPAAHTQYNGKAARSY